MRYELSAFATATASAGAVVAVKCRGREKFINGKFDFLEKVTGVVVRCGYTFFAGHAKIVARNEELDASFKLDY